MEKILEEVEYFKSKYGKIKLEIHHDGANNLYFQLWYYVDSKLFGGWKLGIKMKKEEFKYLKDNYNYEIIGDWGIKW